MRLKLVHIDHFKDMTQRLDQWDPRIAFKYDYNPRIDAELAVIQKFFYKPDSVIDVHNAAAQWQAFAREHATNFQTNNIAMYDNPTE